MIRGMYEYVCKDCGNKFIGADVEYLATAASMPVKCPKCGGYNTYPGWPFELILLKDRVKEIVGSFGSKSKKSQQ